jgi:hypothetical protein
MMAPAGAARRSLRPLKRVVCSRAESPQGSARALRRFDFTISTTINARRFTIPVLAGLGLKDREIGESSMVERLKRLMTRIDGNEPPDRVWSDQSLGACDYLIIAPADVAPKMLRELGAAQAR